MSATAAAPGEAKAGEAKTGGKKKLIIIVVVALVAIGAGGWFSGLIPALLHGKEHEHESAAAASEGHEGAAAASAPIFVDIPDIIANLNNGGRRAVYIKLKAKLELARKEDVATVLAAMPRVTDLFQGYLREMRPEELRSTAGTYRLREELVARTNIAAAPAKVTDVLFVELLVQ